MNKRLVVDVQGFIDEKNKFIPKEFAAYDGKQMCHYVFKQPFSLKLLSFEAHKKAIWLMKNHHGIKWNLGYTPIHCFADIVKQVTENAMFVYVKGNEKAEYIKKYSSKPIIQLDDQPTITALPPKCFYHLKSPAICALSNVFFMYDNFFMNE